MIKLRCSIDPVSAFHTYHSFFDDFVDSPETFTVQYVFPNSTLLRYLALGLLLIGAHLDCDG